MILLMISTCIAARCMIAMPHHWLYKINAMKHVAYKIFGDEQEGTIILLG
jgi:hypothetical protein